MVKNGQVGSQVMSWSAHHLPPGSSVRYVLDSDDNTPIRLVLGDLEQIELEMGPSEVTAIVVALQNAEREIRERGKDEHS